MLTRRTLLSSGTALALVGLAVLPMAGRAADYAVDDGVAQTVANLPAAPNGGWITVGNLNPNQTLTIGSAYSSALLQLGSGAGVNGNSVIITGGGSYSNVAGNPVAITGPALLVGNGGSNNQLTIQNGGSVTIAKIDGSSSYDVQVGYLAGANGNTLLVTGAGSQLAVNQSTIYVGFNGASNALTVANGGTVAALQMRVGGGTGSTLGNTPSGNTVTVTGAGSSLTTLGSFNLGATGGAIGGGNSLVVLDGGQVTVGLAQSKTLNVGQAGTSNDNTLRVSGAGSAVSVFALAIGNGANTGNALDIGNGGQVTVATTLALNNNSVLRYGLGGSGAALATATTGLSIGNNVLVQPYLAASQGLQRTNVLVSLTNGAITGGFAGVDASRLPASLSATLAAFGSHVDLTLTSNLGAGAVLNANQLAVAGGLNNGFNLGSALPAGVAAVYGLTGAAQARQLSLLSGEAATGARPSALLLGNGFMGLMAEPLAPVGVQPGRLRLWLGGHGTYAGVNGSAPTGSHDLTARVGGLAMGAEYGVAAQTVVGLALGGAATDWSLASGLGGGRSNALQLGLYGRTGMGAAYASGALAFGNHWVDTSRSTGSDRLKGDFSAQTWSGRLEAGYRLSQGSTGLAPYAAVQVQNYQSPAYAETGGTAALRFGGRAATDTRTELGARLDHDLGPALLRLRAAWAHDQGPANSMNASFSGVAGSGFSVMGANRARDAALISAGLDWRLGGALTLNTALHGQFAGQAASYSALARVAMAF